MKFKTLAAAAFLILMSAIPVASQTLTVTVTGTGRLTGTGIDCGSDCSEAVPMIVSTRGAKPGKVTLTASGTMTGGPTWGGACEGTTGQTCIVTVPPGGATVSAGFATLSFPDPGLGGSMPSALSTEGPGTVTVSTSGTTRTYRAEPSGGASFVKWTGSCTGSDPVCIRSTTSPSVVKAIFGWPVTVIVEGPGGRVTAAGLDCPTNCSVVAVPPALVLDATSTVAGGSFKEWGGDCQTAGSTTTVARCTLALTGRKNVIARFQVTLLPPPP